MDAGQAWDLGGPFDTSVDVGEPPGILAPPAMAGCSDGSREGFRDLDRWPNIAGCAGAFDQPGVLGERSSKPSCGRMAGDQGTNWLGVGCNVADLCAAGWHVCLDRADVAGHSPTADCERCVSGGERRFFVVAKAASPLGICSADPNATNDLHGCGGLGQPEDEGCAPLDRRMGFADCSATHGVWQCGSAETDSLQEALVVTKPGISMGGALCCSDWDRSPGAPLSH